MEFLLVKLACKPAYDRRMSRCKPSAGTRALAPHTSPSSLSSVFCDGTHTQTLCLLYIDAMGKLSELGFILSLYNFALEI